jgi:hypothetical protein
MLGKASTWLDKAKKTSGGRLPQGKMLEVIQDLADHGVHMTRDILNKLVVKQRVLRHEGPITTTKLPITDITVELQTNVSSLEGVDGVKDIDVSVNAGGRPRGSTKANVGKENI